MLLLDRKMYSNFFDAIIFMIYTEMFICSFYFALFSILVPGLSTSTGQANSDPFKWSLINR